MGLAGGLNLYVYEPGQFNWADPWGLSKCPTVTRGQNGEVLTARATVSPADLKTGTGINASARAAARAMGFQTDDAGHILAKVLGGQGGKGNIFPQLPAINRGGYRVFENEVRTYISKNGSVDIDWKFIYSNGGTRPTGIIYNVSQNGKTVLYSIFGN
ncbi:hypothetical protein F3J40_10815 [Pantoea sp. Acro-835]|uniref:Type VII secretion system protein EssD-like domain-containing protein n=1 Tax=Candidatus Pantoea multigeneris TaxID=2608357 RepID=A0ABX0REJ2_9GAMM|nr:hypothetical protein [Pantoea multigeneris]